MQIQTLSIPDIKIITPKKFDDDRGFFSETYHKRILTEQDIVKEEYGGYPLSVNSYQDLEPYNR